MAITPAQADSIMTDELRLKIIGCGVPNVSRIQIGEEERCTLDLPGEKRYVYDAGTKKLIDVSSPETPPTGPVKRSQTQLSYGEVVDSTITEKSEPLEAFAGSFGQVNVKGRGDVYTFNAQQGDQVIVKVKPKANLKAFVALIGPNDRQVAADTDGNMRYTTTAAGVHKILVMGDQDTLGSYTLSLTGTATDSSNAANRVLAVRPPFSNAEQSTLVNVVQSAWQRQPGVRQVDRVTVVNPNYRTSTGARAVVMNISWRDQFGRRNQNSVAASVDRSNEIGYASVVNNQWQNWTWTGRRL